MRSQQRVVLLVEQAISKTNLGFVLLIIVLLSIHVVPRQFMASDCRGVSNEVNILWIKI